MLLQVIISTFGGQKPVTVNFASTHFQTRLPRWIDVKEQLAIKMNIPVHFQKLTTAGGRILHDSDPLLDPKEITTSQDSQGRVVIHPPRHPTCAKLSLSLKGGSVPTMGSSRGSTPSVSPVTSFSAIPYPPSLTQRTATTDTQYQPNNHFVGNKRPREEHESEPMANRTVRGWQGTHVREPFGTFYERDGSETLAMYGITTGAEGGDGTEDEMDVDDLEAVDGFMENVCVSRDDERDRPPRKKGRTEFSIH
ncbi:hypothetical protein BJ742DRAFT_786088 [Cladochytrium replicatum]|nr:hypothetical protein BJ742DRAFT_786088 [Cladochytrium replicatum]